MTAPTIHTSIADEWPAGARRSLEAGLVELEAELDGDVVWLDDLDPDPADWPDLEVDTFASGGALTRVVDLGAVSTGMLARLRPGGRFVFVEPTGRAGNIALVRSTVASLLHPRPGTHLNRDVPWALRRCGWRFHRIQRRTTTDSPWPFRTMALGVAVPDPARTPTEGRP